MNILILIFKDLKVIFYIKIKKIYKIIIIID